MTEKKEKKISVSMNFELIFKYIFRKNNFVYY